MPTYKIVLSHITCWFHYIRFNIPLMHRTGTYEILRINFIKIMFTDKIVICIRHFGANEKERSTFAYDIQATCVCVCVCIYERM